MANLFPNMASRDRADDSVLLAELNAAGIPVMDGISEGMVGLLGGSPEVKTAAIGLLHGWTFHRYWYYWVASGPGIPYDVATELWEARKDVRINGHCASPSPLESMCVISVGDYHVDTAPGLKALADTIKMVAARADNTIPIQPQDTTRIDEMKLIQSVLRGYHPSMARADALRAIQFLLDTEPA